MATTKRHRVGKGRVAKIRDAKKRVIDAAMNFDTNAVGNRLTPELRESIETLQWVTTPEHVEKAFREAGFNFNRLYRGPGSIYYRGDD